MFCPESVWLKDYLPKDAVIIADEPSRIEESGKLVFDEFLQGLSAVLAEGRGHPKQEGLVHSALDTITGLDTKRTAMLFSFTRSYGLIRSKGLFKFETRPVSRYMGRTDLLRDDIALWKQKGYTVLLYAGQHGKRLADSLADLDVEAAYTEALNREAVPRELLIVGESIPMGFDYPEIKLAAVSEYEIYGTETRARSASAKKRAKLAFAELEVGDLIVHEAHGIGRFTGVKTLAVDGKSRDYIELNYLGGDKLFIPTDQLDRCRNTSAATRRRQSSRVWARANGRGRWQGRARARGSWRSILSLCTVRGAA